MIFRKKRSNNLTMTGSINAPFKLKYWIFGDLWNSVGAEDPSARRTPFRTPPAGEAGSRRSRTRWRMARM